MAPATRATSGRSFTMTWAFRGANFKTCVNLADQHSCAGGFMPNLDEHGAPIKQRLCKLHADSRRLHLPRHTDAAAESCNAAVLSRIVHVLEESCIDVPALEVGMGQDLLKKRN